MSSSSDTISISHASPGYGRSKTYDGQSIPVLQDTAAGTHALWLQMLHQFTAGLKTPTDGDGKLIKDVLFKKDAPETNAVCVAAATTILTHALGKYFDGCMSDEVAADGETAQTAVDLGDGFNVYTLDVQVVWKRALKLASLETTGLTADDLENAPYLHFSQQNATYPAAASFVDAINYIVDWTTAWAARMRMQARVISAERQLTVIRNAITNVLIELDHDMLITFKAIGGVGGLLAFLRRLAARKDAAGTKTTPTLAVMDARPNTGRGGRGRNRGRGGRRTGRGGGRGGGAATQQPNRNGMKCHQCGSSWHLIAQCDQVPKVHRPQAMLLAQQQTYTPTFWRTAAPALVAPQQLKLPAPVAPVQAISALALNTDRHFVVKAGTTDVVPYDPFG